jgi:hypothetical protein
VRLAVDPSKRVCRIASMRSADQRAGCILAPLGPDPLVMYPRLDLRVMDPASGLNSLGFSVRTQG